ncbi:MAG: hypothetical protein WA139_03745 [Candidatus Aenigmatarchaeota archaeon]
MGILDHVSGLEDMVSEKEAPERPKQKPTKAEAAKSDSQLNSRLEKIEDSVASLKESVEDLKNNAQPSSAEAQPFSESQPSSDAIEKLQSDIEALQETVGNLGKEKSGAGENSLQDILRRLDEMESAGNGGKDYSGEIEGLKSSIENLKSEMTASPAQGYGREELENMRRIAEKNSMEMKSRMDVLQKYVDGRMSALHIPQKEVAGRAMEEMMNSRLNEFSRKIDEISKHNSGKMPPVSGTDRNIEEKLKLFALNSDVEKVWKETENLKRYVDEKTKMADGLANSLRVWETRNMQLMEKEHDFDEKMRAFPELKMLESRIRKMERALVELQRHFVAAQITEPIIME